MVDGEDSVTLGIPLLPSEGSQGNLEEQDVQWTGQTSALRSACNVMTITVGIGILSIPNGLKSTGWVGIGYIAVLAALATVSAIMLIQCMRKVVELKDRDGDFCFENGSVTYSCVGRAAFGVWGERFVMLQVHMTLVGVSILFLILGGLFLSNLTDYLFHYHLDKWLATLICGGVVSLHALFKTLKELGILSIFNVCITIYLLIVVCKEVFENHHSVKETHYTHKVFTFSLDTITQFSTFAFAFGTHPCLPSIYNSMKQPSMFSWMVSAAFTCILSFYLVIGIVGYWGFGSGVDSPILNNISHSAWWAMSEFSILLHVLISFGLVLNPTESSIDKEVAKLSKWTDSTLSSEPRRPSLVWSLRRGPMNPDDSTSSLRTTRTNSSEEFEFDWARHICVRIVITAVVTGVATYFSTKPDAFENVLTLVSSITNTFTIFTLPSLFYAVLVLPDMKDPVAGAALFLLIAIEIIIGFVCCVIGTYDSVKTLFF